MTVFEYQAKRYSVHYLRGKQIAAAKCPPITGAAKETSPLLSEALLCISILKV
jgi:hypothetical protein